MRIFRARNMRIGRISEVGRIYLITTTTLNRHPIFADWRIGRLVVREMALEEANGNAQSIAWVLMPDHLHWLVELRSASLSALIQRVKSRSTRVINQVSLGKRTC